MIVPPALKPGDPIRVVAPSGPFDPDLLLAGLDRLSAYDVRVPPGLMGRRDGFLAGDDKTRRDELQAALDCPEAKAILVARGGYGITRILDDLFWDDFIKHPKWIVGFSDVTALHRAVATETKGVVSLHGPNGTTLSRTHQEDFDELLAVLGGKREQNLQTDVWHEGEAEGPLVGGNLTMLFSSAVAERLSIPNGAVVFLEDVTETSYRIDRMLNALLCGAHFSRVAAVVVGEFHECSSGKFGVSTESVLRHHLGTLGVPILAGAPIGHAERNFPLICGARARVNTNGKAGSLTVRLPA